MNVCFELPLNDPYISLSVIIREVTSNSRWELVLNSDLTRMLLVSLYVLTPILLAILTSYV